MLVVVALRKRYRTLGSSPGAPESLNHFCCAACCLYRHGLVHVLKYVRPRICRRSGLAHARYQACTVQFVSAGSASGAALHGVDHRIYIFAVC
jgi:hypothetical protein